MQLVVALLTEEYEGRFRHIYEDTVTMVRARPREASDEARNALDHISLAFKAAAQVDDATNRVLDGTSRTEQIEAIWVNVAQARRHLVVGRFLCTLHQILWLMKAIRNLVVASDPLARATMTSYQTKADEYESQFMAMTEIEITLTRTRSSLEQEIRNLEDHLNKATVLLAKFSDFYCEVADKVVGAQSV